VSTLTHKTSSIIATRPENFGGAIPVPTSKTTAKTSAQAALPVTTSSSATHAQTTATTSGVTSTATTQPTSAENTEQTSEKSIKQSPTTTNTQQASSTVGEQVPSSAEHTSTTVGQNLSTGSDQASTSVDEQPTSIAQLPSKPAEGNPTTISAQPTPITASQATTSQAPSTIEVSSGIQQPTSATTDVASDGASSAVSPTGVPIVLPTGIATGINDGLKPTTQLSSAAAGTKLPSVAMPITTAVIGTTPFTSSDTNAVSNAAPRPSATGSEGDTRVSSVLTVPTNGQTISNGAYTELQQTSSDAVFFTDEPKGQSTKSSLASKTITAIAPVLTIDSTTITPNPSTEYIIGSQTLTPGGPAITIGGTAYSLTSSFADVQSGNSQSPASSDAKPPQITLGSSIVTANPNHGFIYASQTLSVGGSGIVVDGTTYSLATSASETLVVENGVTSTLVVPAASVEVTQSVPVVHIVASAVATDSISAADGSESTISGYLVAVQSDSAIKVHTLTSSPSTPSSSTPALENGDVPTVSPVVKVSVLALVATSSPPAVSILTNTIAPVLTIGSYAVVQNSASEYVIGEQTLVAGDSALELQGTTYSLATSVTAIVVNGASTPLSVSPSTAVLVAGQTLTPAGSAIQVQGTTYSLASSGLAVVVDGKSSILPITTVTSTVTPISVVGTISVGEGGVYTVGGRTYTVSSSLVSEVASAATVVGVDGKTSTLSVMHTEKTRTEGAKTAAGTAVDGESQTRASSLSSSAGSSSLDGSRTPGGPIVAITATGSSGRETGTRSTTVATASTAGAQRLVQRDVWEVFGAVVIGGLIMF
jgi:hypothetical protein